MYPSNVTAVKSIFQKSAVRGNSLRNCEYNRFRDHSSVVYAFLNICLGSTHHKLNLAQKWHLIKQCIPTVMDLEKRLNCLEVSSLPLTSLRMVGGKRLFFSSATFYFCGQEMQPCWNRTVAVFLVLDWGDKAARPAIASGCCAGPPSHIGWAVRYENPTPLPALSPSQGLIIGPQQLKLYLEKKLTTA